MNVTLRLYETVKIAKMEDPYERCHYLYFKLWQKGDKSRVYINDYKGRTIGYIDTVSDETIINDNQGCSDEEIERAINGFMAEYVVEETAEQSEPEQPEKIKVKLNHGEEASIASRTNPCDKSHYIRFVFSRDCGKGRVHIYDYAHRFIGYIDAVSGETVIRCNQGISMESIEYAINVFMAAYAEVKTTEQPEPEQPERAPKITKFAKSQIMKRAWEIARQGVAQFGGKVREYFAISLKMAWAEIKETLALAKRVGSLVKAYDLKTFFDCAKSKLNIKVNKSLKDNPDDYTFVKSHKAEIINLLTSGLAEHFWISK